MINFLFGFLVADLLFSLILFWRQEVILIFDKKLISFSLMVDIFLLLILFLFSYGKYRKS